MASNFFTLSVLLAVLFVTAHAASTSYSCVMMNGQRKCAYKDDPDGNIAAAAAGIGGGMGAAGAGAGTQDNFNTDYQQIGAGEGPYNEGGAGAGGFSNNYPQFNGAGVGPYGAGSAVAVGTGGFPNNYPQFNGNPMDFVRDFMSRFGGYRQIPAY